MGGGARVPACILEVSHIHHIYTLLIRYLKDGRKRGLYLYLRLNIIRGGCSGIEGRRVVCIVEAWGGAACDGKGDLVCVLGFNIIEQ